MATIYASWIKIKVNIIISEINSIYFVYLMTSIVQAIVKWVCDPQRGSAVMKPPEIRSLLSVIREASGEGAEWNFKLDSSAIKRKIVISFYNKLCAWKFQFYWEFYIMRKNEHYSIRNKAHLLKINIKINRNILVKSVKWA